MSPIVIAHKAESSEGERPSKCEQTQKLMLICSDVPKKATTENSKFPYCLLKWMNPTRCKYTL